MSDNKETIRKLIEAKNREANSYEDRTCYNAAYCYGYVDGATMALNTLSSEKSAMLSCPIILTTILAHLTLLQFVAEYI